MKFQFEKQYIITVNLTRWLITIFEKFRFYFKSVILRLGSSYFKRIFTGI